MPHLHVAVWVPIEQQLQPDGHRQQDEDGAGCGRHVVEHEGLGGEGGGGGRVVLLGEEIVELRDEGSDLQSSRGGKECGHGVY
jgi:hypothetical protein